MTSDFNPRPESKSFGSSEPRTPTDITIGGFDPARAGNRDALGTGPDRDEARVEGAVGREVSSAKAEASAAATSLKETAAGLASDAKAKAAEGVEKGKAEVTSSLGDFAAAIRKASDELGERDQSMAAGLVREVAVGLEQAAGSIKGQSFQDITRSVAGFARRQPTTFLIGAALAGIALGRFARASGEHAPSASAGYPTRRPDEGGRTEPYPAKPFPSETGAPHRSGPSSVSSRTTTGGSGSEAYRPHDDLTSRATRPSDTSRAFSPSGGSAPPEGPSPASLGHGSGSFDRAGDDDGR